MIKIQTIKQSGNKYILKTSKGEYTVQEEVLLQFGLLKPQEIDEETFKKIKENNDFFELYHKIINYLAFKMRSKKEVKDKLLTLGADEHTSKKIITRLTNEGYIDDEKYLKLYIKDKLALTLDGPKIIEEKLVKLGFYSARVKAELDLVPIEVWEEKTDKIIAKKVKALSNKKISNQALRQKIKADLIKAGFSPVAFNSRLDSIQIDDSNAKESTEEKIRMKLSKKYEGKQLELRVKQKLYQLGYKDI